MAENYLQMNVSISDEDASILDQLMTEDAYDNRSAFVRRLIRQEWARRFSQPNVSVTIEQAQEAGRGLK